MISVIKPSKTISRLNVCSHWSAENYVRFLLFALSYAYLIFSMILYQDFSGLIKTSASCDRVFGIWAPCSVGV